ncbi:four helix bundle protein [Spirosomataceae bacterium TFI 002]|nr:four helix bundle protein [Spirosomataceae bacterium TFI 002]
MTGNFDFGEKMKLRSKQFCIEVIKYCRTLPKSEEMYIIKRQLIKSATSVAANYRAACRGRSNAEFYAKICIVLEESDESLFWLELIRDLDEIKDESLRKLILESSELTAIMSKTRSTMKKKNNESNNS